MSNKTTRQYFLERICELKAKKESLSDSRWDYEYKKRLKEVEFMLDDYPQWLNNEKIKESDILNHRDLLIKFFMYFRDNGEKNIGMTIEQFVDMFLSEYVC